MKSKVQAERKQNPKQFFCYGSPTRLSMSSHQVPQSALAIRRKLRQSEKETDAESALVKPEFNLSGTCRACGVFLNSSGFLLFHQVQH